MDTVSSSLKLTLQTGVRKAFILPEGSVRRRYLTGGVSWGGARQEIRSPARREKLGGNWGGAPGEVQAELVGELGRSSVGVRAELRGKFKRSSCGSWGGARSEFGRSPRPAVPAVRPRGRFNRIGPSAARGSGSASERWRRKG